MQTRELNVISIHPDPSHPLGTDLRHILSALEGKLEEWVWCVKNLDWLGNGAEAFCEAVEAAGSGGLWIDSRDLLAVVSGIYQTIEGEFIAFPRSIDRHMVDTTDLDLSSFPASKSVIAIVAVDGCYFDVYSKDPEVTSVVEKLPNARSERPDLYF
jgi:hypothetical protein